jgi:tetratricopeptide (TPR) repeat protein
LCPAAIAWAGDSAGAIAKADELWKKRDSAANNKAALEALEAAYKEDENNFDLTWRLSRTHFWIADQTKDRKKKAENGKRGFEYGEKAAGMKPNRVEGWYWGVVSLGMYSEGIGILASIKEGNKKKFDKFLDKSIAIDKAYEGAGPLRTKGRSLARLPWPMRDRDKAVEMLKESLKVAPDRLRSKFYIADVLHDDGKDEEAGKVIEEVLAADPKSGDYPDNIAAQAWAKELKKKLEE